MTTDAVSTAFQADIFEHMRRKDWARGVWPKRSAEYFEEEEILHALSAKSGWTQTRTLNTIQATVRKFRIARKNRKGQHA